MVDGQRQKRCHNQQSQDQPGEPKIRIQAAIAKQLVPARNVMARPKISFPSCRPYCDCLGREHVCFAVHKRRPQSAAMKSWPRLPPVTCESITTVAFGSLAVCRTFRHSTQPCFRNISNRYRRMTSERCRMPISRRCSAFARFDRQHLDITRAKVSQGFQQILVGETAKGDIEQYRRPATGRLGYRCP